MCENDAITIGTFDGGYGRKGKVVVTNNVCCVCRGGTKEGISIDSSEGEYRTGHICFGCIDDNNPQR